MAPNTPQPRSQEQSIRARKHSLYEDDDLPGLDGPRRSFRECLRTTPAAPLPTLVKALLWVVGILVILLLAAALVASGHKKPKPAKPAAHIVEPVVRPLV